MRLPASPAADDEEHIVSDEALRPEDLILVHQLQARYGHLVDARDWRGVRDLFTADAVLDLSAYGQEPIRGADDVERFYGEATHPAAHHLTNVEVWRDGDGVVRCRSKWLIAHATGQMAGGDYVDVLVDGDDGWRIQEREITRRWPSGEAKLLGT
jgi:3-phenylpropionate/cinnamic acid dioxygenase small subunit